MFLKKTSRNILKCFKTKSLEKILLNRVNKQDHKQFVAFHFKIRFDFDSSIFCIL